MVLLELIFLIVVFSTCIAMENDRYKITFYHSLYNCILNDRHFNKINLQKCH